jgi:uncharacterized protein (TIGR02117 family)
MKSATLKTLKWTKRIVLGFILFVLVYVIAAFVLSVIPVGKTDTSSSNGTDIYILSNGVHTDIVVPVQSSVKDWSQHVKFKHTKSGDSLMKYLAFGWGDKGFYLETPTWADLKFSTAFKAMFHLGTSAMHCTFYSDLKEGEYCRKIKISDDAFRKLTAYIEESFKFDASHQVQHIANNSYGRNDAFYEANRVYDLFYTCNTWANNALKCCGQKACLWTPSDKGIFYHY